MLSVVMGAAIGDGHATPPPQKTADDLVDDRRTHRGVRFAGGYRSPAEGQGGGHIPALSHGGGGTPRLVRSGRQDRSAEHTSELQSLMRTSYAVICLNKKTNQN